MKQKQGQDYIYASIVLDAIFFLAIPFLVTFDSFWQYRYVWYIIPFVSLYLSILARKHDKKTAMPAILFSFIGVLTVLLFAVMFSALVK